MDRRTGVSLPIRLLLGCFCLTTMLQSCDAAGFWSSGNSPSKLVGAAAATVLLARSGTLIGTAYTSYQAAMIMPRLRHDVYYMKQEYDKETNYTKELDMCDLKNIQDKWLNKLEPDGALATLWIGAVFVYLGILFLLSAAALAAFKYDDGENPWPALAVVGLFAQGIGWILLASVTISLALLSANYSGKMPDFLTSQLSDLISWLTWTAIELPCWLGLCVVAFFTVVCGSYCCGQSWLNGRASGRERGSDAPSPSLPSLAAQTSVRLP